NDVIVQALCRGGVYDEYHRHLVEATVGPANHSDLCGTYHLLNHPLNLRGRDILSSDLEHVFSAIHKGKAAVIVEPDEVACGHPPFGIENISSCLWIVPVLGEQRHSPNSANI